MDDPALPQPVQTPSPARLAQVAATLLAAANLRTADAVNLTDELFRSLDAHDAYLEKTWPGSHPSDDGSEARNRAVRLREQVMRSQARITAASGWATIAVKLSTAALGVGVIWRLIGG